MSWSCQVSRTSVLVGRQAKTTCVERFLSLQKAVRQAILRNSDSILVRSIYIDSVFSNMSHTILAKAIELSDSEHRRMQHLLNTITSLSNQATGVVASERDSRCIIVRKHFLPRTALYYDCRGYCKVDRLSSMESFVEKIIACDIDHPAHRRLALSAYQVEESALPGQGQRHQTSES